MKSLENILKRYEIDINTWSDDFGEGFLFLDTRERLIPYENDIRVQELDDIALKIITKDNSKGNDKLFLEKLKYVILNANYHHKVA